MSLDEADIHPSRDEFVAAADRRVISVYAKLLADDITPVGAFRQLCGDRPGTFLFESAEQGTWSRWSFIGVNNVATLYGDHGESEWIVNTDRPIAGLPATGRPLEVLDETLRLLHTPRDPKLPPFTSGMVGYLGYELVRERENIPDSNPDDIGVPEMVMMLAGDLAVLDHHTGEIWLIANAINFDASAEHADRAWQDAADRVRTMAEQLAEPHQPMATVRSNVDPAPAKRQRSHDEFVAMVEAAKEHIRAGDIFQVVPSQRFEIDTTTADALAIYRELRTSNPSPYLYLLQLERSGKRFALVGSSPEALVTVKDGLATTRPIAGTRPRGANPTEDLALETELLADEKERAEHLMLVDLGRNDLGRVCEPGTVEVTEFMHVHRYSHVMHLEASVVGKIKPNLSALDVTMSCFPAGTLSGAPKVRAMQIIDELETSRRGPYGGVIGYFDFTGDSDAAIAIRTALITDGKAYVQAGAGIVADSVPDSEDLETRNKAAAVIGAVSRASGHRVLSVPAGSVDARKGDHA
ncbi:anthranilate synthase component I [Propionimicrobium sp. PCR01-08-3]|uniref:anthranilate synthase component I n=1 Tax=Propionimicrobium sp. PCR01-08-3 TaxID=3052086 RepID=UPI00255CD7AE|nr:anthranilate synthase component I [Propionimicrobium sp. PCR01-08-3]WIY83858.1 anthranilate synthase component I [Propionimicrobium sp. PCR01-08-3]